MANESLPVKLRELAETKRALAEGYFRMHVAPSLLEWQKSVGESPQAEAWSAHTEILALSITLSAAAERIEADKAELSRCRVALRKRCIQEVISGKDGRVYFYCKVCDPDFERWWYPGNVEGHAAVTLTIDGVETTGPCPARPEEGV